MHISDLKSAELCFQMALQHYKMKIEENPKIAQHSEKVLVCSLTSVGVIEEDEAAPVVVVQQGQQSPFDGRPKLQSELAVRFSGEAGRHQADMQSPAE